MESFTFNKTDFDINKFNLMIENYCKENDILDEISFNIQLICEEFLSNILFPNFDGEVEIFIIKRKEGIVVSFVYADVDFMNKINEQTILSLKILRNKTQKILTENLNNKTIVKFIVEE